jgi:hypothetical protein
MPKQALPTATIDELKDAIVNSFLVKEAVARHAWFETKPGFSTRQVLGLPGNQAAMAKLVGKLGDRLGAPKIAVGSTAFKLADCHVGYQVAGTTQRDAESYRSDAKYLHEFLKRRFRAVQHKDNPRIRTKVKNGKKVKYKTFKKRIRFSDMAKA